MPKATGASANDQSLVRRANELSVLRHMRDRRVATLSELAAATGLSWRTTNVVADQLLERGWLVEMSADRRGTRPGRPGRRLGFRAEAGYVMGIDIALRSVAVTVADLGGDVRAVERRAVDAQAPAEQRMATTVDTVTSCLSSHDLAPEDMWAATVGTSGIVGPNGHVTKSVVMRGWTGMAPAAHVGAVLPCRIGVGNDCNMAAVSERWNGHSATDMVYLLTGSRLGIALVIGGRLHEGFTGSAGEIGEIPELGWNTAAARLAGTESATVEGVDAAALRVFAAARAQDPAAVAAVDEFAATLTRGLVPVVLTLDPELVVLGGGFSGAADLLLPRLTDLLTQTCVHPPRLAASEQGDDAVGMGAIRLALDQVDAAIAALDTTQALTPPAVRDALRRVERF